MRLPFLGRDDRMPPKDLTLEERKSRRPIKYDVVMKILPVVLIILAILFIMGAGVFYFVIQMIA